MLCMKERRLSWLLSMKVDCFIVKLLKENEFVKREVQYSGAETAILQAGNIC